MTITIAKPTAAVVFDVPTEYIDRSLATASWWDQYEILPGAYAFEWTNIDGTPWNADPEVRTNGFIANIGPYYGSVTLEARLLESYRESRLLSEVRAQHDVHAEPKVVTISRRLYAYQLPGAPRRHGVPTVRFMGGRVVSIEEVSL